MTLILYTIEEAVLKFWGGDVPVSAITLTLREQWDTRSRELGITLTVPSSDGEQRYLPPYAISLILTDDKKHQIMKQHRESKLEHMRFRTTCAAGRYAEIERLRKLQSADMDRVKDANTTIERRTDDVRTLNAAMIARRNAIEVMRTEAEDIENEVKKLRSELGV